ncbi:hypothetical protein HOBO_274 [Bacillus phage Hobo]|uniref:Uncharacterized protein n=2 Tax=Caeruleovirus BM15 TaxID=1985178 RepID=A0A0S2MU72_9CAUD|nr:hypothetical protein FD732_gp013 [Bacillus phage BM15]YP_009626827.1 hypothetical protein FD732_gp067 [Bacillus phage BM15]AXQ66794.1 hypothetical protein HOBO_13 [Bacillus phage Hobo]ALO79434.1 hypothetical protein BM10_13 [Bacillus phage BM15]ALO79682.1 hypothetical protein BM10_278 [Bacillus phage BM15]AXQ67029.1 hypothetical protein HOBO_274 [Bacillus phage Hobo]
MSKTIPLHEIESLISQLEKHTDNDKELLSKVKEPTLRARLEGKTVTYDYVIGKLIFIMERSL